MLLTQAPTNNIPEKAHYDWQYFSLPEPLKARLMPFDEEGRVQLVLLVSSRVTKPEAAR